MRVSALAANVLLSITLAGCGGAAHDSGPDGHLSPGASPPQGSPGADPSTDAEDASADAYAYAADAALNLDAPPPYDGGAIAAEMNDVSVLFPLPSAPTGIRLLLSPAAVGLRGVLFPEALYDATGHILGNNDQSDESGEAGGPIEADYDHLRVVAARIDPCFASLAPDPHGVGCTAQLRLVFQPILLDRTGVAYAFDSALHVFFQLTRADFLSLAAALVAAREANSASAASEPLAPQPIIAAQGLEGPMATAVKNLILTFAGEANLTRVTRMNGDDNAFNWEFEGDDVQSASAPSFSPLPIPSLPGNATTQSFTSNFGSFNVNVTPPTTSKDDFLPLTIQSESSAPDAGAIQAAFQALVRVDNPTVESVNTIDCSSCHLATPTSKLVALPEFFLVESSSPAAFAPNSAFVPPGATGPTFAALPTSINFHAFSYDGLTPGINQRTVNETASVVDYLNALTP